MAQFKPPTEESKQSQTNNSNWDFKEETFHLRIKYYKMAALQLRRVASHSDSYS